MAVPQTPGSALLDFSQPLDVSLLDATVAAFYGAGSNEEVPEPPAHNRHHAVLAARN